MIPEIFDAARDTLALDIWPIPTRDKAPIGRKWTDQRIGLDDLPKHFGNGCGLGWLLGIGPRFVVDADIDSVECLALANFIPLPATDRIFGRDSARSAHRMYEFPAAFKSEQFRDPVRKKENEKLDEKLKDMLVELRGTGQQTVVPPTSHGESGEIRKWERQGAFAKPAREALVARTARLAAGGLLLRYTAAGFEEFQAVAGIFAAAGLPEDDAVEILAAVYRVARKESPDKCERETREAYRRVARNEPCHGYAKYAEIVGDDRARLITKAIYEWLALKRPARSSEGFVLSDRGKILPVLANAVAVLAGATEWQGVVGFNEFSLQTEARKPTPWTRGCGPWADADDSQAAIWLQHHGVVCNSRIASEAIQTIARQNTFHPVKEYFARVAAAWDRRPRLDNMLIAYAGAEDNDYSRAVSRCWMISAVARVYRPGCQADYTLIFEGAQGKLKSSFFQTLAGQEWFADHISDLGSKDARLELHGVLIMELAELATIRKSEVERVKNFLTARADQFRAPYDRRTQNIPRSNVFAGTTNDASPFTDETGNRRFWPVKIGFIDIEKLADARDQLWGETVARYNDGECWWFRNDKLEAAAEQEQEKRYEPGVWDPTILEWIENPKRRTEIVGGVAVPIAGDSTKDAVTVRDILIHALGKELKDHQDRDRKQIVRCLTKAGWMQHPMKLNGVTQRVYFRNDQARLAAMRLAAKAE